MRRFAALALGATLLAPPGTAAGQSSAPPWRDAVKALLSRRAGAVLSGDLDAFEATAAGAPAAFRRATRSWFERIRALPLGRYELELAPDGLLDLSPALRTRPAGDEVRVVEVVERIGIRGYDRAPTAESVFLTVVRRGTRWTVVADDHLDDLGLHSARNLWNFGPVRAVAAQGVLVITRGSSSVASRIRSATVAALDRADAGWPFGLRRRAIVMIPSSAGELSRIFATTIDLGPFVAFASSSVDRDGGGFRLTAPRVWLQPATFFDTSAAFRSDVLSHELLHVATRAQAGIWQPSWLEEGVAQIFGERARPSTAELRRRVRAGRVTRLPRDEEFFIGSRADIRVSYEASAHFVGSLVRRYGRRATARFYRAVGRETPDAFGTARYHLDRAALATFGISLERLERAWVGRLREEFS